MTDPERPEGEMPEEENGLTLDDDESRELQGVFSTVFPQYLVPLEELVGQLLEGKSSPAILEGLKGAVAPLASAAGSVGVTDLKLLLDEFQEVASQASEEKALDDSMRNSVIDVFYRLKEAVQNISQTELPGESARSDFVARLSAIDGVESNHVQKILAAGISSAEQVAEATTDEIAAVTGLEEELARRVHETFGGKAKNKGKTKSKDGGGSGRGGSGRLELDTTSEEAKAHRDALANSLEARIALVRAVCDRIRLEEALERETRAIQQQERKRDEVSRAQLSLKTTLFQRKHELEQERELTAMREAEIVRLQNEIRRLSASSQLPKEMDAAQDLRDRLQQMKRRIATRTG